MSEFVARWSSWVEPTPGENPKTPGQGACKTSKSRAGISGMRVQPASKTSKSPFAGFAGSLPPRSGEKGASGLVAGDVAAMTLDEFAKAGLIVQVQSTVLGCQILFVSDAVPDDELESFHLPIYRAAELRKLALCRPKPRALLTLHDVKTIFIGAIGDVRPQDEDARRNA